MRHALHNFSNRTLHSDDGKSDRPSVNHHSLERLSDSTLHHGTIDEDTSSFIETINKQLTIQQSSSSLQGLSKFHLSMVRSHRQRLAVGEYPVTLTLHDNPTRRWLNKQGKSTSSSSTLLSSTELRVNGTTPERSLASLDRLQWLDPGDRVITLELLAELCDVSRPAYVQYNNHHPKNYLWVTSFAVTDEGRVTALDATTGTVVATTSTPLRWPNAVEPLSSNTTTSVLVCDGFLVPTKDFGGVYRWTPPPSTTSTANMEDRDGRMQLLTTPGQRWFYHRAIAVDLKGDGVASNNILTARCRLSALEQGAGIVKTGQLVWLEQQQDKTYTTHVLATGPDVMFAVADLDPNDGCIEVIASEFFSERVVVYSIQQGPEPKVVFRRVIDEDCGRAYACILADLDPTNREEYPQRVIDAGSTVDCLAKGDAFSHVLVTSHECGSASLPVDTSNLSREGGSLFAYEIPKNWKTAAWKRTTIAEGFQVNGKLNNMINPGAPGFCYTFSLRKGDGQPPLIAVAGDCAESAYIFQRAAGGDYRLLAEIRCESTVGSLAVRYDDASGGFARLYIPCYERDRILVFGFGDL